MQVFSFYLKLMVCWIKVCQGIDHASVLLVPGVNGLSVLLVPGVNGLSVLLVPGVNGLLD